MVIPLQILMNAMKKINVMSMLLVTIHLEATPALAIADTLEMELTAQVCKIKQHLVEVLNSFDHVSVMTQILMSVRIQVIVSCVM